MATRPHENSRIWCLHVGAHKTATTHLQALLVALRPALNSDGIGAFTPEQLRPVCALALGRQRPRVWLGRAVLRRNIEARISEHNALQPRMILSEENILGNSAAPLQPRFYPHAGFRMRALASALMAGGKGGIWLSVRSLDEFLPAAYATALKHIPLAFDAETLKRKALDAPPDWGDLVARLARAAPGVPITVWDYADYRANCRAIIQDITGVTLSTLPELPDPPETKTPDAAAIRAAEALPRGGNRYRRAARIAEIYEAAKGPRFTLFTAEEADRLKALHNRQLAAIRKMPDVRVLQF